MAINWKLVKNFTREEFDDPDFPGSGDLINPIVVFKLDHLRSITGWPIITHNKYGLHGCVCVKKEGHTEESLHYTPDCMAVDFHFNTKIDSRAQVRAVLSSNFGGVGIYYDWKWEGKKLPIGFHVDVRSNLQLWRRTDKGYIYLLK
jgi:hypothetical protein